MVTCSKQIRRQTRLRKEYLYRKALEDKEKSVADRKRKVKQALAAGKPIPTELRHEEAALRKEIALDDAQTELVKTHVDDEYAFAGVKDPKVVVTTARDPSSRLAQFAKVGNAAAGPGRAGRGAFGSCTHDRLGRR
jgi:U3 small nucleolar ribonucleoprotein protein IMP4